MTSWENNLINNLNLISKVNLKLKSKIHKMRKATMILTRISGRMSLNLRVKKKKKNLEK